MAANEDKESEWRVIFQFMNKEIFVDVVAPTSVWAKRIAKGVLGEIVEQSKITHILPIARL